MNSALSWTERIPVHQPAWVFVLLFLLLAYMAWIRMYYGNIYEKTVHASTNFQVSVRMFKDNSLLQNQLDMVLYILYFLAFAFFIFILENYFSLKPFNIQGFTLMLFNLLLITVVFLARFILNSLCAFLFNQGPLLREYQYHNFIFNKLLGIILIPLLVFAIYTRGIMEDVFIYLTIGVFVAIIVMRVFRGVVFSFKKDISIFYMFLYLCALEIAPLILLYRWVEGVL